MAVPPSQTHTHACTQQGIQMNKVSSPLKHLEQLFNTRRCSQTKGTELCPLCEKNVDEKEYRNHLTKCYKFGKEGTLLRLPEEGATMKFKNFKNKYKYNYINKR